MREAEAYMDEFEFQQWVQTKRKEWAGSSRRHAMRAPADGVCCCKDLPYPYGINTLAVPSD